MFDRGTTSALVACLGGVGIAVLVSVQVYELGPTTRSARSGGIVGNGFPDLLVIDFEVFPDDLLSARLNESNEHEDGADDDQQHHRSDDQPA